MPMCGTRQTLMAKSRFLQRISMLLGAIGISVAYQKYQREKVDTLRRLRLGSRLLHSKQGIIEYATEGEGRPFLMLHGSGGGYQQGLLLSHIIDPAAYQIIAPSRPGYGQTPLASGKSPMEQADLFAALLDKLEIEKVIVGGISAGGMGAMQFALRHPDRCAALVLLSSIGPNPEVGVATWQIPLLHLLMSSDFVMWSILTVGGEKMILTSQGVDVAYMQNESAMTILREIWGGMFPVSRWRDGTINDIQHAEQIAGFPLHTIDIPTVIIHGTKDITAPYANAQRLASLIPRARFVTVEDGTHFMVGTHRDAVASAIETIVPAST
jgi:2-hydroxy-6-oxonona-2,4-dienedioate hydrolase